MLRFLCAAFVTVLAWSGSIAAQDHPAPPTPADRTADTFRIYSSLVPLGETAGPDWPHGLWLIRDETLEMASPGQPCHSNRSFMTDPRSSVHPPSDRQQDFGDPAGLRSPLPRSLRSSQRIMGFERNGAAADAGRTAGV